MIGPDLQAGLGGFGDTIAGALLDLAEAVERGHYRIRGRFVVEVKGWTFEESAGESPVAAIRSLADRLEHGGYSEADFAPLDWTKIAMEAPLEQTKGAAHPRPTEGGAAPGSLLFAMDQEQTTKHSLEQELQKIYDSELNVEISWFWDSGVDVKLGDKMNGFKAETNVEKIADILPWLQQAILEHYPMSTYARTLRPN